MTQAASTTPVVGEAGDGGLVVGARVRLEGLQTRPDLNGQTGILINFDEEKGKWAVKLDRKSEGAKLFKPSNLVEAGPPDGNTVPEPGTFVFSPRGTLRHKTTN